MSTVIYRRCLHPGSSSAGVGIRVLTEQRTQAGLKLVEGRRMTVPGTPIYLDLDEVFAEVD